MYASVGAVATLGIQAVWNQAIIGVTALGNRADSRFIAYWLRHYAPHAVAAANSATQANLNAEQVVNFPFPDLRVTEQRRIADFLDDRVTRIDQIIAARRNQAKLARIAGRRRVMDLLLGDDFSQLGIAPWFSPDRDGRAVRLGSAWQVIDCKHRTPSYIETGYPVISPGDIRQGRLDLSVATRFVGHDDYLDLADDLRRCLPGDLVYSRNASAGTAAFVSDPAPFTMGQDVCRITSRDEDQLYLAYCLNYLTEPQLDSVRIGSTFTRINVEQIKSVAVPMREVSEQNRLATECDGVVAYISQATEALQDSTGLLAEYKQSLITAAVTGELDVTTAGSGIPG